MKFEPRPPIFTTRFIAGLVVGTVIFFTALTYWGLYLAQRMQSTSTAIQQPEKEQSPKAYLGVCKNNTIHILLGDGTTMPVADSQALFMKC